MNIIKIFEAHFVFWWIKKNGLGNGEKIIFLSFIFYISLPIWKNEMTLSKNWANHRDEIGIFVELSEEADKIQVSVCE